MSDKEEPRLEKYLENEVARSFVGRLDMIQRSGHGWYWTIVEDSLGEPDIYFIPYDPPHLDHNARLYKDVDIIFYTESLEHKMNDGKLRYFEKITKVEICKKKTEAPSKMSEAAFEVKPKEKAGIPQYYSMDRIEMATVGCFNCPEEIRFWTLAFVHKWPIECQRCGYQQDHNAVKMALQSRA